MSERRIQVLLVDDDHLVRAGLRGLLDGGDIEIAGEAADGAEAVSKVRSLMPDVVCMDVRMPRLDGIQATRQILKHHPEVKVLVLTTFEHDEHVAAALEAGADGFLLKRAAPDSFAESIRTVHRGDSLLFPSSIRSLVKQTTGSATNSGLPDLTEREGEVLRLMAAGLQNAEIAAELCISLETVKTHVVRVLGKLQVRDRTQAVICAYRSGFVPLG
ncbi:response regulator [Actinomadura sp. 3N407]|uniref:response regulator n=1 Tax=Actinomadura sp. 3N407 TaxID=3457423 RepID=UPI003FCE8A72